MTKKVTEMSQDEFNQYLEDNNITDEHKEYDNIFCAWLFGGDDPNEIIEEIRQDRINNEKSVSINQQAQPHWYDFEYDMNN